MAEQLVQAEPMVPHVLTDCAWHAPLAQQPVGQVFGSHAQVPFVVSHRPLLHALQSAPLPPHFAPVCEAYGTHVPPTVAVQQPIEHDVASHTHWPLLLSHSWPVAQPAQAAPPVPHDPLLWAPHCSQVPVEPPLQQPLPHVLTSHTHWPVLRSHSRLVPHALHATPPAPQEAFDSFARASQVVPLQQPAQADPPQLHIPLVHADPPPHAPHACPPVPHDVDDWAV